MFEKAEYSSVDTAFFIYQMKQSVYSRSLK